LRVVNGLGSKAPWQDDVAELLHETASA